MKEEELHKQIKDKWGEEAQLGMLQEKCAECIVAVNKYRRYVTLKAWLEIGAELADVQNMIDQLAPLFPNFERGRIGKLERVKLLLDKETK